MNQSLITQVGNEYPTVSLSRLKSRLLSAKSALISTKRKLGYIKPCLNPDDEQVAELEAKAQKLQGEVKNLEAEIKSLEEIEGHPFLSLPLADQVQAINFETNN